MLAQNDGEGVCFLTRGAAQRKQAEPALCGLLANKFRQNVAGQSATVLRTAKKIGLGDGQLAGQNAQLLGLVGIAQRIQISGWAETAECIHAALQNSGDEIQLPVVQIQAEPASDDIAETIQVLSFRRLSHAWANSCQTSSGMRQVEFNTNSKCASKADRKSTRL